MKKHTLYIGLNDATEKRQLVSTENARRIVENIFYDVIGGATLSEARGIYKHTDGTRIVENTIRAEVFGAEDADIEYIAEYLKKALNQESIAVEYSEVVSRFI